MAQGFLLKYAEIGVKGKNRYKFEDALCNQIRLRLSEIDGEFTVEKESGRVFVQADGDFDFDEVIETLQRVFGLAGISPVEVIEDKSWDNVTKEAISIILIHHRKYVWRWADIFLKDFLNFQ